MSRFLGGSGLFWYDELRIILKPISVKISANSIFTIIEQKMAKLGKNCFFVLILVGDV